MDVEINLFIHTGQTSTPLIFGNDSIFYEGFSFVK